MMIEVGQLAAFFGLIAAVLKLIDWLMPSDKKINWGKSWLEG